MKKSLLLARVLLCACAAAPGLAVAQAMTAAKSTPIATVPATVPATAPATVPATVPGTAPATAKVTDPAAAVPPVVYQSVFAGTPTGVEMESADWKKANAEVGQFKRGHVDILKWDEAQTKGPTPSKPMAEDAAKPVMAPASPPTAPSQSPPLPTSPAARSTPTPPAPAAPSVHKH